MSTFTDWHTGNKVIQVKDAPSDQFWSNAEVDYLNNFDTDSSTVSLNTDTNRSKNTTTSIVVSDFGFALPNDSEILDIEVRITRVAKMNSSYTYNIDDITNFINNTYDYPPKGKNGGKLIINSRKPFKLENWEGTAPIYDEEVVLYPTDASLYETIILNGLWDLPDSKLTNLVINSSDFLFSTKAGLFCYDDMGTESITVAINSIEMRIEYYYPDSTPAPIG